MRSIVTTVNLPTVYGDDNTLCDDPDIVFHKWKSEFEALYNIPYKMTNLMIRFWLIKLQKSMLWKLKMILPLNKLNLLTDIFPLMNCWEYVTNVKMANLLVLIYYQTKF